MYGGLLLILFGEALGCASAALAIHTAVTWLALHLFVVGYEEPTLRRRFGDAYLRYCQVTPRWIPRGR
jgi:protein-S-isoprenylcysteine O-methyltransferase Ste14